MVFVHVTDILSVGGIVNPCLVNLSFFLSLSLSLSLSLLILMLCFRLLYFCLLMICSVKRANVHDTFLCIRLLISGCNLSPPYFHLIFVCRQKSLLLLTTESYPTAKTKKKIWKLIWKKTVRYVKCLMLRLSSVPIWVDWFWMFDICFLFCQRGRREEAERNFFFYSISKIANYSYKILLFYWSV